MKREEIFEMAKHLDEKYILEAAPAPRKNIKLKKRIVTFGIAAAITASLSIGAFAAYRAFNRDTVGNHYTSSAMDKMEKEGYAVGTKIENEHFRIIVETAVKDESQIKMICSLDALDAVGKEYLEKYDFGSELIYTDNNTFAGKDYVFTNVNYNNDQSVEAKDKHDYTIMVNIPFKNNSSSADSNLSDDSENRYYVEPDRPMTLRLKNAEHDVSGKDENGSSILVYESYEKKYDDIFKGLEIKIEGIKEIGSSVLYNEDGDKLTISALTISIDNFVPSKNEIDMEKDYDEVYGFELKFKDGTVKKPGEVTVGRLASSCNEDKKTGKYIETLTIDLREFIDYENVESVKINGKTYKRK